MNYLVAVSGGVDSVVLLDMLVQEVRAKGEAPGAITVAHVDHGIREDSAADARFVEALAGQHDLPFVSTKLELGAAASEQQARDARYEFLFAEAKKRQATIVTAHHQDDMIETVAINLRRGTGWRGLAVLDRDGVHRPLLTVTKQALYEYAHAHGLEWVEDSTNHSDRYLRNRLRRELAQMKVDADELQQLRGRQLELKREIALETAAIAQQHQGSRYFLTQVDQTVAIELLGMMIKQLTGVKPVRLQLQRAVIAIKTARPGSVHHVGDHVQLTFSSRKYQISML